MYSSRSEQTDHRRQYSDSGSRHQGNYQDKQEERHEFRSDTHSDSHHQHGRSGHSSRQSETYSRISKEYSNSPKRWHSNNGTSRDWSRKSQEGRSLSPDCHADGNKKRRLAAAADDRHRYRREPEDEMYRRSQQSLSQQHLPKYFKCSQTLKVEKSTDSQQSDRHVAFTSKQEHDDYRPLSAAQLNREYSERSRKTTEQKTQSMKHSIRVRCNLSVCPESFQILLSFYLSCCSLF